jgi:hypothetical protein
MYHLVHPLYPTFVVYLTTISGRCLLCETSSLCKYFNLLKNFPFGFNKYTNNFLFCQIYLKLFLRCLISGFIVSADRAPFLIIKGCLAHFVVLSTQSVLLFAGFNQSSYLLQEKDSNLRPCGYEPRELPLLYPAILNVIYDNFFKLPNIFLFKSASCVSRITILK